MSRLLIFVSICSLGGVLGGVVRRDVPSTEQIVSSQGLTDIASRLMGLASQFSQPNQATASGSHSNSDRAIDVESIFRGFFSNAQTNTNYDLSEMTRLMNMSSGIPAESTVVDTSSMTREQFLEHVRNQSDVFSNMVNSNMKLVLEPRRVAKFLNLTNQASDQSNFNNPEVQAALQTEYQNLMVDYQNALQNKLNGEKPTTTSADPVASAALLENLQKQIASMTSMYNAELSNALKPTDLEGALTGDQTDNVSQNLGKALLNIFQSISQGKGPFNQPLHWDSTSTKN